MFFHPTRYCVCLLRKALRFLCPIPDEGVWLPKTEQSNSSGMMYDPVDSSFRRSLETSFSTPATTETGRQWPSVTSLCKKLWKKLPSRTSSRFALRMTLSHSSLSRYF